MDNPFQSPVVLSLCSGMLGIERGLERALGPVQVAAYVEIETFVIYNLVRQMEKGVLDPAPVWANLKTFPAASFHRKIHGITGGYPCQPFSHAGKRKGEADPRHLWPHIRRLVRAIKPVWCFFENVEGHLNMGYGTVYKELRDLGYAVEAGLYTAAETGAPHQRKRLFILAISEEWLAHSGTSLLPAAWRTWGGSPEPANSSELGNPNRAPGNDHKPGRAGQGPEERRSKMGNPNMRPQQHVCGEEGKEQRQPSNPGDESMADTLRTDGSQERPHPKPGQFREKGNQWPARPGEPQHPWEAPRTQPRMGSAINGYNYREDLLRMLGNGVVEQTAEIAFRSLLKKHLSNLQKTGSSK